MAASEKHWRGLSPKWRLPAAEDGRSCSSAEDDRDRCWRDRWRGRHPADRCVQSCPKGKDRFSLQARLRRAVSRVYRTLCRFRESRLAINKFTYAELEEEDTELKKLQGWLETIHELDFYRGTLADEAGERLRSLARRLSAARLRRP